MGGGGGEGGGFCVYLCMGLGEVFGERDEEELIQFNGHVFTYNEFTVEH